MCVSVGRVCVCGVCAVCVSMGRVCLCRACVVCVVRVCLSGACGCAVCWGGDELQSDPRPVPSILQAKAAKSEQEARRLRLRSLQYLERYVCLVLFSAYLHLEKAGSWQRPFSAWMREVRVGAGDRLLRAAEVVSRSALGPARRLRLAGRERGMRGADRAGWGLGWAPAPCVPEATSPGCFTPQAVFILRLCPLASRAPAAFQPWARHVAALGCCPQSYHGSILAQWAPPQEAWRGFCEVRALPSAPARVSRAASRGRCTLLL